MKETTVYRVDAGSSILGVEDGPDGSLRAQATIARAGIYEYAREDGTTVRELVLPEHLFDEKSLSTLGAAALTLEHPPEFISPDNADRYSVGHVHDKIEGVRADDERDFGYVQVRITARLRKAIEAIQKSRSDGEGMKTSPGYFLPYYDATPGKHPIWGRYDAIQGPRVYNHLALTKYPRGGDRMAVHMDAADVGYQIQKGDGAPPRSSEDPPMPDATTLVPFKLDSIGQTIQISKLDAEYIRQEVAAQVKAFQKEKARGDGMKEELDAAKAEVEALKKDKATLEGKLQAASEDAGKKDSRIVELESERTDASKLRALLAPRLELETSAREILPKDKHDSISKLDDDGIRRAVVGVVYPKVDAKSLKEGRLDGLYLGAVASFRDSSGTDAGSGGAGNSGEGGEGRVDSQPFGGGGSAPDVASLQKNRLDSTYQPARKAPASE